MEPGCFQHLGVAPVGPSSVGALRARGRPTPTTLRHRAGTVRDRSGTGRRREYAANYGELSPYRPRTEGVPIPAINSL